MGRSAKRALAVNVSLVVGIVGGLKFADYLLWDQVKYDTQQEKMEADYWKKYGKPEHLEGQLHKSSIRPGEFYVTYLKEKNPHEAMEKQVYSKLWATK